LDNNGSNKAHCTNNKSNIKNKNKSESDGNKYRANCKGREFVFESKSTKTFPGRDSVAFAAFVFAPTSFVTFVKDQKIPAQKDLKKTLEDLKEFNIRIEFK